MFDFTPIENDKDDSLAVPFLENARADFAPYYTADQHSWTVAKAKVALESELGKLSATVSRYREGDFTIAGQVRRGYQIEFIWKGVRGRIMVAGLPIEKTTTDVKLNKAKIQALLNVRDWIKVAITARIFSPGEHPLISHLILKNGRTTAEQLLDSMHLPQLPAGEFEIIEGEVMD
jgi:hypothetical protein